MVYSGKPAFYEHYTRLVGGKVASSADTDWEGIRFLLLIQIVKIYNVTDFFSCENRGATFGETFPTRPMYIMDW